MIKTLYGELSLMSTFSTVQIEQTNQPDCPHSRIQNRVNRYNSVIVHAADSLHDCWSMPLCVRCVNAFNEPSRLNFIG